MRLSPAPADFKEARLHKSWKRLTSVKFLIPSEGFCIPQRDVEDTLLYNFVSHQGCVTSYNTGGPSGDVFFFNLHYVT